MNRIKEFRMSKRITQEKLARKMDVTLSYYSQIERGRVPASREFMLRLKKLYPDVDINEMFFNDEVLEAVVI